MGNIKDNLLEHSVVNQLEADFGDNDFDSMSEMISNLIHLEPARKVLFNYLSDTAQNNLEQGLTKIRY